MRQAMGLVLLVGCALGVPFAVGCWADPVGTVLAFGFLFLLAATAGIAVRLMDDG